MNGGSLSAQTGRLAIYQTRISTGREKRACELAGGAVRQALAHGI
jgi:hypothetical protein